ncbi:sigma-70 family RNA polymerase sigma factor, partial [Candidatus Sumerlaeota bacterium]|nr:sigma-70 family RNA polymerase sigma factor [Candidatus Sumerlaeota bacterium]
WPFRTWLFCIARNLALNALRRPRAEVVSIAEVTADGDRDRSIVAAAPSPVEQAIARERQRLFERALETLSPRAATIFTLFYQESMSIAEVAHVVGARSGTIKVALHRLRETLKRELADMLERPR